VITAAAGLAVFVAVTTLFLAARSRKVRSPRPVASDVGGTVTVEVAELRKEPSDGASGAGALPRGARVRIFADRGRWLEVRTGGGKDATAFVAEEAVETDPQRRTREDRAKRILSFTPVSGLVAEDTDVLLASFPSAPRSGRLRRGTAVSVYAVDHDYYAVRAADGGLAFLHSSDVDLVPPDPRLPAIVPAAGKTIKDVAVNDLAPAAPAEPPEPGAAAGTTREGEAPVYEEPLEPAALISKVDPDYPEAARRAGVEGTVVLDAEINESGQVTRVTVARGLPLGVSEAAVAAVERWKYRPARGRGGPVASHKTVRILFTLGQ
jgi:TonB family protein